MKVSDPFPFGYTFRRSARARRMRMQFNRDGVLTIVAPQSASLWLVERFVASQTHWIEKRIKHYELRIKNMPKHTYWTGDRFFLLGDACMLTVREHERKRPFVSWRNRELIVSIHSGLSAADQSAAVRKTLETFFRTKAQQVIYDRLEHFNEHYGFHYNRVTIRDQKSRWGSCSRLKNLNFSWRLVLAPIEVIDYVIAHELCHLSVMNHSRRFWTLVEETVPDHKKRRKWLREHEALLHV